MNSKVNLASCSDYSEQNVKKAIRASLDAFGGAAALAGGKRVLIKVNLLMASTPSKAVTTHPAVVKAIAEEFIAAGCSVEIADSCGGAYTEESLRKLYAVCGMKSVAEKTGAVLNYDTTNFEREIPEGKRLKSVQMISPVERADFIISAAKLKTHRFAYYTGAVKNMFGVIPGLQKAAMHSKFPEKNAFCEMLVELCESVSPDLAIIDGVIGMEGQGPSGGEPKFAGVLIASENPYAADSVAMEIMGLDKTKSHVHSYADRCGLVGDVSVSGGSVSNFRTEFKPAYKREPKTSLAIIPGAVSRFVSGLFAAYPYIMSEKCVGCGRCAEVCPESTISVVDKKAVINYNKCIRCYCCHELCPIRAVEIKRFAKFRKRG